MLRYWKSLVWIIGSRPQFNRFCHSERQRKISESNERQDFPKRFAVASLLRMTYCGLLLVTLTQAGCGGKATSGLSEPTSLEQRIQEMREARIESDPIVPSNVEQRLQWREERSKEFHKWRQVFNPEYRSYPYECLIGDTLTVYLKQYEDIRREKISRPNRSRSQE